VTLIQAIGPRAGPTGFKNRGYESKKAICFFSNDHRVIGFWQRECGLYDHWNPIKLPVEVLFGKTMTQVLFIASRKAPMREPEQSNLS
jgi:hypothetical protein